MPADRVFDYDHPHRPTTCYHDFAPSSASAPFLTPVRLHGTDYHKTFARNLTSLTFENFLKLTILILRLTFNNCILSFYLDPWPSCNGRTRNAVSMNMSIKPGTCHAAQHIPALLRPGTQSIAYRPQDSLMNIRNVYQISFLRGYLWAKCQHINCWYFVFVLSR